MKNIRVIFIIIVMLISHSINAQSSGRDRIIKYDLISIAGDQATNSMGIMMGFEYQLNDDRSLAFDAMYIFPCTSCNRAYTVVTTEKTNGLLLSAEYRFYLIPNDQMLTGFHLGPQIIYQHTMSEMRETYDGGTENFYHVHRDLLAAHAMAGYQVRIAGPLFFNPSIGLGLRYINSRNENKKGSDSGQHEFPYNKDYESGARWFPSLNMNIKLGLKL